MQRVRFIYWSKRLYHSVTLKIFLLGMFMASATVYISLPNVLRNMPSLADISASWRFFTTAFANTQVTVQLLSVLAFAVLVWLASDIVRSLRRASELSTSRVSI